MADDDDLDLFGQPIGKHRRRGESPFAETRAAIDDALQRVEENAEEYWKARALEAVTWCARTHQEFTADEVWERLEQLNVEGPHTPAALGPIFLAARRAGVIEKTGRWQPLSRFSRRHRALMIWRPAPVRGFQVI